jgi:hypothetical protein
VKHLCKYNMIVYGVKRKKIYGTKMVKRKRRKKKKKD